MLIEPLSVVLRLNLKFHTNKTEVAPFPLPVPHFWVPRVSTFPLPRSRFPFHFFPFRPLLLFAAPIHRSSLLIPHSPFPIPRSPFKIPRPSFPVPQTPFTIPRSSFHVHRSPFLIFYFLFPSPQFPLPHTTFSISPSSSSVPEPFNKIHLQYKKKYLFVLQQN